MTISACPRHEVLVAYGTGELAETSAEAVTSHVVSCPACQAELKTIRDNDTFVSRVRASLAEPEPFLDEPGFAAAITQVQATVDSLARTAASVAAGDAVPPDLGELGEYQLVEKLGEGGMGAVYKARQKHLGRLVALKVLPQDRSQDQAAIARFYREMRAVGQLSHPNIVQAHDAREIDGSPVLAMEYVDGLDLSKLVTRVGALRVADACELIRQTALGLQHAHEHGLVHRDIKPSNLMLSTPLALSGRGAGGEGTQAVLKILDLGLALLETPGRPGAEMTAAGSAMGTADYISPEQVTDSHSVDIRSDIYSLGCTLYKLLGGRATFVGPQYKNDIAKMMAHVQDTPQPITLLRTDLPPGLVAVIERMMAKKPADRYATPAEVVAAIAPFAAGADLARLLAEAMPTSGAPVPSAARSLTTGHVSSSPHTDTGKHAAPSVWPQIQPRPASRPPRRRSRVLLAAAAGFLFVLLGAVVIRVIDKQGRETVVKVPDGSEVTVNAEGQLSVKVPGAEKPTTPQSEPSAKQPEVAKSPTVTIEPEPLEIKPGEPLSGTALTLYPPSLTGVTSWTIDTRRHRGHIKAIACSPTEKLVATGGQDGTVRIWAIETGEFTGVFYGHAGHVLAVAWSPDGQYLASAGTDGNICLWRPNTRRRLRILRGHEGAVNAVAWSPDGSSLVSGSDDKSVRFWDTVTGQQTQKIAHASPVACVAWSSENTCVAAVVDKEVHVYDAIVKKGLWKVSNESPLTCTRFSREGTVLAAADRGGRIRLWDAASGAPVHEDVKMEHPKSRTAGVSDLAFLSGGKQLASAGADGRVRVWDLASGNEAFDFVAHASVIQAISWSDAARCVVSLGDAGENVVRLVDLNTRAAKDFTAGNRYISCPLSCAWSPDGETLAVGLGSSPESLWLWDKTFARAPQIVQDGPRASLTWTAKGDRIAAFPSRMPSSSTSGNQVLRVGSPEIPDMAPAQRNRPSPGHRAVDYWRFRIRD